MPSKTAATPFKTGSVLNRRLSLREAINATIDGCGIDDWALAQKASIGYRALSEFRKGPREFTTKTIDYITGAFTKTEFYFFLEVLERAEGATANTPAPDCDNLIPHPAFNPLVSHVVKHSGAGRYHKLIQLIVNSRRPDKNHSTAISCNCSMPLFPFVFFPSRIGMREALNATIEAFNFVTVELAQRSGVAVTGISSYRTNRREMMSRSMDQILATLSTEEYVYFTRK
ncbi:MAG: hypothetical protein AAFQ57_01260 [Cyanobacteria bacterium J06626_14]